MPFKKGQSGNLKGRPKGSVNKVSQTVREMFQVAAEELGGSARLVQWARESRENERVFWQLATKLLPLQVAGDPSNPVAAKVEFSWRQPTRPGTEQSS